MINILLANNHNILLYILYKFISWGLSLKQGILLKPTSISWNDKGILNTAHMSVVAKMLPIRYVFLPPAVA